MYCRYNLEDSGISSWKKICLVSREQHGQLEKYTSCLQKARVVVRLAKKKMDEGRYQTINVFNSF